MPYIVHFGDRLVSIIRT